MDPQLTSALNHYQAQIGEFTAAIATWQRQANLELAFIVIVILCGALITLFQSMNQTWSKSAIRLLAAATTILTAINTQIFTADYRVLRQSAIDAGDIVEQLHIIANAMGRPGADIAELESSWYTTTTRFRGLQRSVVIGSHAPAAFIVYAQSAPAWVSNPPIDRFNLFFKGQAANPSLAAAEQQAYQNAIDTAVAQLRPVPAKAATLRRLLAASAARQNNFFTFDKNQRVYTYYILLRVTKDIANAAR